MIGIISHTVDQVLDENRELQQRSTRTAPMLERGLKSWRDYGAYYPRNPQFILMAAATEKRSTPLVDERHQRRGG